MLQAFSQAVIRFRWPVIIVFLAVSALFGLQLKNAEVDPEVKNQLPPDMRARIHIDQIEKIFGGTDMIMLVMTADDVLSAATLKRMKKLAKKIERINGIDRVLSLFTLKDIRAEGDRLLVDPAVKRIPKTEAAREKLRAELRDNELVYGNVVSKDFKVAAIIGLLEADAKDEPTLEAMKQLEHDIPGPEKLYIAGMPYIRVNVSHDIKRDMQRFLPIGLLIMLVFLFLCFGQLRGVVLPFIVVVMAILFSMGLIPLLGWKIQMITVILPVILIAVANDYGIHIMARYQEENFPGVDLGPQELAKKVTNELLSPVVVTGVTTIAGLLCLLSHIVTPAKQLGILSAAGVAFALLASLTFIPAVLAVLPRARPVLGTSTSGAKKHILERMLASMAALVIRRPKTLLVMGVVISAAVGVGIDFLVVDTNPINYYDKDAPVAVSAALVDKNFGGSGVVSIVARGNVKDPKLLTELDDFEKKLGALPEVGQTSSVAKVVRKMNRVLNTDDPRPDRIPDSADAVAQYFLLYSMSGDPEDFERMVDFNYQHAQLTARINTLSTEAVKRVMKFIHADIKKRPKGMFPLVGGFVDLLSELVDAIIQGQVTSLSLSLLLVSLLVMLLFRSVVAGLLAVIPLTLSMLLLFGLMGYLGIELNIATAMLSSIMIGVGVDYTIHFLWRYRVERRAGREPAEAVRITLTTTGRGIVFNALSVMVGFVVVLSSSFMPVKFFGFLVIVSIGTCLLGALWLLPAVCLLLRPKFLEPENIRRTE
ncbi:MAG TPA: MMPL family transporter [Myxococcota bacterium]|nr:MMPL family transporter [Myxococcota bacterium]